MKLPHAARNCIGFRKTAFQRGGKKVIESERMKDKKTLKARTKVKKESIWH